MYCCPGCLVTIDDSEALLQHLADCNQEEAKRILEGNGDGRGSEDHELVPWRHAEAGS